MDTTKKVCILTGAGGRLGTRFCQLHADKYEIVAVYRRRAPQVPSQLQSLVDPLDPKAELEENRHPVYALRADLSDERDLVRIVEVTLARFNRIDVLINAAVHSVWSPMVDSDQLLASLQTQFNTNVCVPLRLAVLIARNFWRDRAQENVQMNRNVINVSSIAGVRIYSGSGQSAYSASKAALNFLTWHMAEEFRAFGVRVNATAPDAFPRLISTDSVADSIVRLEAGTLSGKVLVLNKEGVRMLAAP